MVIRILLSFLGLTAFQSTPAESPGPTTLPRPPIEGTWQVTSIDQSAIPGGIKNFAPPYFSSSGSYLPIGTRFSMKFTGAWGTNEPTWMEIQMTFHPPYPTLACAEWRDKEPRRLMCDNENRDGTKKGPEKEEKFLGHVALHFLGRMDDGYFSVYENQADLEAFMKGLSYQRGDPVFRFGGDYWKDVNYDFALTRDPNRMLIVGLRHNASGRSGLPKSPLDGPVALVLDRVR